MNNLFFAVAFFAAVIFCTHNTYGFDFGNDCTFVFHSNIPGNDTTVTKKGLPNTSVALDAVFEWEGHELIGYMTSATSYGNYYLFGTLIRIGWSDKNTTKHYYCYWSEAVQSKAYLKVKTTIPSSELNRLYGTPAFIYEITDSANKRQYVMNAINENCIRINDEYVSYSVVEVSPGECSVVQKQVMMRLPDEEIKTVKASGTTSADATEITFRNNLFDYEYPAYQTNNKEAL